MVRKSNTLRGNITLLAVSTVLMLVIAEVVLRVALPPPIKWTFPQEEYSYDPEIHHWLLPNQHAFTHDKVVITNSAGIRDAEYGPVAAPGTHRIVAIGDSQTFGNGLDIEGTWPKQLEAMLNNTSGGSRYEVINAGLPASDTWQHEIILERMVEKYQPNTVILAFYANDVVHGHLPVQAWVNSRDELTTRAIYLLKQSALLLTIREAYSAVRQAVAPLPSVMKQQALLNGEDNDEFRSRWKFVEEAITSMKLETGRRGIRFLIAALPRRDQVNGALSWDGYYSNLETIAMKQKIPVISLLEPLQRGLEKHQQDLFIAWDGHNSAVANRIIADEISAAVLEDTGQARQE